MTTTAERFPEVKRVGVMRRMGGNFLGQLAVPGTVIWYFGWLRDSFSSAAAQEVDPLAAAAVAATGAAVGTGALLEIRQSHMPDRAQRLLGKTAAAVTGAITCIIVAARNGENTHIRNGLAGASAGLLSGSATVNAVPYWGNQSHERAEEAARGQNR